MQSSALSRSKLDALCDQGRGLHQAGRLDEARQIYEAVLGADPAHFQALHLLGVFCIQSGDLARGAELIGRALTVQPNDAAALGNLATALNGLGRHEQALGCSDRAIALQPLDASAHGNRGAALHALGRSAEALPSYDRAAALRPDQAKAHFNRGVVLYALGRLDEAVAAHRRATALQPAFAEAHRNAGRALRDLGRRDEALAACDAALALRPADAELHTARANVLCDLERPAEALEAYDRAIALKPDHADAWSNRMVALRDLRRPEEALESCQRAITLEPGNARTHGKLGAALYEFQRLDEALASFDRAIALDPDDGQAHLNRAIVLNEQRRLDEAMASFDRALALAPDDPEAHFHQAMCRLTLGEEAEGWRQYEWRWRTRQFEALARDFPMPLWLGGESLQGRTILVHAEQGLGDALQFCRYVPVLADRGATVVFEVYPGLVRLMRRLAGVSAVIGRGEPLPASDFRVPLMSLPLALGAKARPACRALPLTRSRGCGGLGAPAGWDRRFPCRPVLGRGREAGPADRPRHRPAPVPAVGGVPAPGRPAWRPVRQPAERATPPRELAAAGDWPCGPIVDPTAGPERLRRHRRPGRQPRPGDLLRYVHGASGGSGRKAGVDPEPFRRLLAMGSWPGRTRPGIRPPACSPRLEPGRLGGCNRRR